MIQLYPRDEERISMSDNERFIDEWGCDLTFDSWLWYAGRLILDWLRNGGASGIRMGQDQDRDEMTDYHKMWRAGDGESVWNFAIFYIVHM